MTREEIIRNLKYTIKKHENKTVDTFGTNISVMCKDILDYLEQEPCDCISREQALKALGEAPYVWADCDAELQAYEDWRTIKEMLEGLPSVTLKPKVEQDTLTDILDKIRNELLSMECMEEAVEVVDKYRLEIPFDGRDEE